VEGAKKLLRANPGLLEYSDECANLNFPMVRDNATRRSPPQNDVTAALTENNKAEMFERSNRFGARDTRQFSHVPLLGTWSPTAGLKW